MRLYSVENWRNGYISINDKGNIVIIPQKKKDQSADLMEIINHINQSKIAQFPILFRFPQIIEDRLEEINKSFLRSMKVFGYRGDYSLVYPLKVNQRREVAEYVVRSSRSLNIGLEVGSRVELLAARSLNLDPESLLVCNGYKDEDYLKLALKFSEHNKIVIVVDIFEEIFSLIKCCDDLGIKPMLGLRTKLFSKGGGRWTESGGSLSKFGLSTAEILEILQILTQNDMLNTLKMLHFHVGSQITDIRTIKDAVTEASRIYAKIRKVADIEYFNVGGGLGIDYDGSKTPSSASTNYSLQEYSNDVVYTLQRICEEENVPCPTIVSESGRAITAYHSFLVFKVIGKKNFKIEQKIHPEKEDSIQIKDLGFALENMDPENYVEYYHDAFQYLDELLDAFNLGNVGLKERAKGEILFWNVCQKAAKIAQKEMNSSEEFEDLKKLLGKKYIGGFSLFQSAPDIWGVQQLFPIVPLHRHHEQPSKRVTIADMTCDSDGEIKSFAGENKDFLALHRLSEDEDYYLGMFLLGAYQDSLGSFHNLLGRVNEVHVIVDEESWHISQIVKGDRCGEVLQFFNYDPESNFTKLCQGVTDKEKMARDLQKALSEYTYFRDKYVNYSPIN
ncbi:MAG: biosynthetic arginine decarboxylase [Methanotrichaceae archaeon]